MEASIRRFFGVMIPAWHEFVQALKSNVELMGSKDIASAKQSIKLFEQDLEGYTLKMHGQSRFDFEAISEMVRQSLRR